jgi:hypothetical protein
MRRLSLIAYFGIPALVFLTIGLGNGKSIEINRALLADLPINYLWFAAPQIAWFLLFRIFALPAYAWHAGQIGATLALITLHARFECCVNNENGLGWLIYWPFAGAAMIVTITTVWLLRYFVLRKSG